MRRAARLLLARTARAAATTRHDASRVTSRAFASEASPKDDENARRADAFVRALGLTVDDFPSTPVVERGDKAYVDRRRVRAVAGDGGAGCVAFAKDGGSRRRRGADGGDGGRGGDAAATARATTKGLGDVKNVLRATNGGAGGAQGRIGRRGVDAIASVPLGTIVWREIEEEDEDEEDAAVDFSSWGSDEPVSNDDDDDDDDGVEDARESKPSSDGWTRPRGLSRGKWVVVADLTREGDTCVLARGGRGGKGNKRMPTGREAGTREPGAKGQEFKYVFELKTVADVGLVGLPNAGKSTLLRALSNATPRVGAYAFTTTQPQLGALETSMGHKITVADIPGLIEGAHDNRGLGHNFLRHIERCETLLYVVDLSSADGVSPWRALEILERELEAYLPGLSKRTSVVIGTKMDAPNAARALEALRTRVAPTRVLAVSALESRGTEDVARVIEKEMEETYTSWK